MRIRTERIRLLNGQLTLQVLIFSTIAILVLSAFVLWAQANIQAVYRDSDRALAFMIAESGVESYRWHLGHAPNDYQDGTDHTGPYTHDFTDKDGNVVGTYVLDVTPPEAGSTVVTIKSTGKVAANPDVQKVIETKMAVPSFTKYAAVVDGFLWYPEGSEIFGRIHSNSGVRIDGFAHNLVTSAVATFNDPTHGGGNTEFGVHTHKTPADPLPPAPVPERSDVFGAGRDFPVAPVDFVGLSKDLSGLKASAQADHYYWGEQSGNKEGYHVLLKTNDMFDLYEVTATEKAPNNCVKVRGEHDWATWSIETENKIGTYALPPNGVMFFETDVWVDGQIDTARVTIGAGAFPEQSQTWKNITINKDLRFTNYDGRDVIGLVAQGNVNVGLYSNDVLRIDGALIAQNGQVGRYYYKPAVSDQNQGCAPYDKRQQVTLYGLIASKETYGFKYDDGTGYQDIVIIYDANLPFGPPPNFPLTSGNYSPIFWSETQ